MQIYDYLILSNTTAKSTNGNTYQFQIPATYYNEKRSSVAQVEMCQLRLSDSGSNVSTYITTNLGMNNVYHAKGKRVLGLITDEQPLAISTPARPDNIEITFHKGDDTTSQPTNFILALKFSYGNQIETSQIIQSQY